ncbi:putative HVA22-like protein g isoform X1 [Papaver somniferum]|uniref:putative HVA22-like protein g isoform X1 n=1 Tax=Papaver somniferum TaxID=3469 RepID=UPI000E70059C|nr:putative HVA22-like protein g isoform X1 [Papaver somniferum]XP_026432921.1 putative HVA22-like protein g isoform X1 [Papaver somniferum]
MMGSVFTRLLVMLFGYAYPAFECFKAVEKNKMDTEQLLFWCQYWILAAMLTVSERVMDVFISWVPMYFEAKLVFFIYLWYPKTKGTTYVYESFFRPYLAKHETEIDRSILELRARFTDITLLYVQKATSYGQTRAIEIMQYVAAQTVLKPKPTQQEQSGAVTKQSSTLAQNLQSVPTAEDKPHKQPSTVTQNIHPAATPEDKLQKQLLQTTRSKNEVGNVPAQMASSLPKIPEPTSAEDLLEKLEQSPLRTKSSPARMTISPKFTEEVTSQFKENEAKGNQDARVRLRRFRSSVYH